jgi:hypothetical protein
MARPNLSLVTPVIWAPIWTGAVGVNASLVNAYDVCARVVCVGVYAAGCTLVLRDIANNDIVWSYQDIVNQNGYIRGQWIQATQAGSAGAHTLKVGW